MNHKKAFRSYPICDNAEVEMFADQEFATWSIAEKNAQSEYLPRTFIKNYNCGPARPVTLWLPARMDLTNDRRVNQFTLSCSEGYEKRV